MDIGEDLGEYREIINIYVYYLNILEIKYWNIENMNYSKNRMQVEDICTWIEVGEYLGMQYNLVGNTGK